jgi:hypothetical protein
MALKKLRHYGVLCLATLTLAVAAMIPAIGIVPARSAEASMKNMLANRCILCSAAFADKVPRICNSCDNKHRNKCILCNAAFADKVPRICNSCDNRHRNKCILCNAAFADKVPRICNSCNNKF